MQYHYTSKTRVYLNILLGAGPLFLFAPMLVQGPVIVPLIISLCGLILANGSYVMLEDKYVISVNGFIFRKRVALERVRKIRTDGIGIAGLARAVIIEYRTHGPKRARLQMSIGMYGELTIGKFLRDLNELIPNVSIDGECKAIMEKDQVKASAEDKRSWSTGAMVDDLSEVMFPGTRDKSVEKTEDET